MGTGSKSQARIIVAATAIGIQGALINWMVPGFMALFGQQGALDNQDVGYVAAWEINAMALTIGLSTFLIPRVNWRLLVGLGLGLMAVGNIGTGFSHTFDSIMIARVVTGAGEGIAIGLSFATLGRTALPDRAFAIYLFIGALISAFLLLVLPWLQQSAGSSPLFIANGLISALVGAFLVWLPDGHQGGSDHPQRASAPIHWRLALGGLAGSFLYFLAQGATFSYMEKIGDASAITAEQIGLALAMANLSGAGGAGVAGLLPPRWGRGWPLIVSGVLSVISFLALRGQVSLGLFIAAAVGMTFAWNLSQPLLSGLCSDADADGRIVCAMGSIQTVGFGFGPAIAALLLTGNDFSPVLWTSTLTLIASVAVMLAGMTTPARARYATPGELKP